jgi:hypothetical protein
MIIYDNNLDVVPGGRKVEILLNQYDTDFLLAFNLFARSGTLELESGTTAAIRGTKPDGNGFSANAEVVTETATVLVTGDEQMTVVSGRSEYEITLYKGEKELNSANFILNIERAALDKDTPSSHSQTRELVAIEGMAVEITAAADRIAVMEENVESLAEQVSGDASSATAVANQALATANQTSQALATKADTDGEYDTLTAGVSKQLKSTVGITDNAPYLFRTSGGSADIGDLETDTLVGGTVGWNQTVTSDRKDGVIDGTAIRKFKEKPVIYLAEGFVYLIRVKIRYIGETTLNTVYILAEKTPNVYATFLKPIEYVSKLNAGETVELWFMTKQSKTVSAGTLGISSLSNFTASDYAEWSDHQTFNLTQMFGSTVADALWSMSPKSLALDTLLKAGFFADSYYAHDNAHLISVKATSHDMVGFNAYDNTTGQAKVVGGNVYQITGAYTALSLDGETVTPDADGYFTPSQSGILTVTGGNATTTCVHLKWDGEKDGEWEPYVKHSYALDPSLELRGIPFLNSNNELCYSGDTYESDGTVTRNYDIVDLGDITWSMADGVFRADSHYTGANAGLCTKYMQATTDNPLNAEDKTINFGSNYWYGNCRIFVKDSSYSDAASFKAAMVGVKAVVLKGVPTIEQAAPYQNPQQVDDFGTEEYVDSRTVPLPVGHTTFYQANLRAKLEMAPNSPDGDGDYIVRQTDGENEYVPLMVQPCMMVAAQSFTISPGVSVAAGATYNTYGLNLAVETQSGYTPAFAYITGFNGTSLVAVKTEITDGVLDATVCNIGASAETLTEINAQIIYTQTA